jgi:hypothetical protein
MKRCFRRFIDDRFVLTTLQNPLCEVRTYAELVPCHRGLHCAGPDARHPRASRFREPRFHKPRLHQQGRATNPGSVVAGVVTAGSSLPSLPSSSSDDDELTAVSAPEPRRKAKSKSRRKSELRHSTIHPEIPRRGIEGRIGARGRAQDQALDEVDSPEPVPLERHTRKCSICNHPHREYIEEAFLQWRSPDTIKRCWDLQSRTAIYHHAHAFNLFALRNRNLQLSFGNIIEDADNHPFTTRDILHAIRVLAHVNEDGRRVHPTHKSEVIYSAQRLPAVAGLPAYPKALPTGQVTEPILTATQILNTDANH